MVDPGAGRCALASNQLGKGRPLATVLDVFRGRAAELAQEKPQALRGFLLATTLQLLLIALPFGLALWFLAPASPCGSLGALERRREG